MERDRELELGRKLEREKEPDRELERERELWICRKIRSI
jgi:hypothetical protein